MNTRKKAAKELIANEEPQLAAPIEENVANYNADVVIEETEAQEKHASRNSTFVLNGPRLLDFMRPATFVADRNELFFNISDSTKRRAALQIYINQVLTQPHVEQYMRAKKAANKEITLRDKFLSAQVKDVLLKRSEAMYELENVLTSEVSSWIKEPENQAEVERLGLHNKPVFALVLVPT